MWRLFIIIVEDEDGNGYQLEYGQLDRWFGYHNAEQVQSIFNQRYPKDDGRAYIYQIPYILVG